MFFVYGWERVGREVGYSSLLITPNLRGCGGEEDRLCELDGGAATYIEPQTRSGGWMDRVAKMDDGEYGKRGRLGRSI